MTKVTSLALYKKNIEIKKKKKKINKWVFRRFLKTQWEGDVMTCCGRLFHTRDAATHYITLVAVLRSNHSTNSLFFTCFNAAYVLKSEKVNLSTFNCLAHDSFALTCRPEVSDVKSRDSVKRLIFQVLVLVLRAQVLVSVLNFEVLNNSSYVELWAIQLNGICLHLIIFSTFCAKKLLRLNIYHCIMIIC